jgi:hypothetical protein
MRANWYLNGCDYLMLSFDYELRRHGFAGNSCQIVLELGSPVAPERLEHRLEAMREQFPILHARPAGLLLPEWKAMRGSQKVKQVRVHRDTPALAQSLFNQPLDTARGELVRFDLVERQDAGMELIFTWAHALMDAPAAEHFLALVGNESLPLPPFAPTPPPRAHVQLRDRFRLAWRNLYQLDQFCKAAPRGLGQRHPGAQVGLAYHVESFSAEETRRVQANGVRLCGILGDAQYHAAVAVTELHRLHRRLGSPSPSYVLPVPVGMRSKGGIEPWISNQVGILMVQFLPEHLETVAQAVLALKSQTEAALRAGMVDSGVMLSEMFRFLPLPIYTALLKTGLRGEICSLFFGDTGVVNPLLARFLDAPIEELTHVAAVTPSPGVGVVFCYFRGRLRLTVLHAAAVLNEAEAVEFGTRLRARLLEP